MALKELQHNEIFFASRRELNDPYDTKSPAFFKKEASLYKQFIIYLLLNGSNLKQLKELINVDAIADYLSKEEHGYDSLVETISSKTFRDVVLDAFQDIQIERIANSEAFIRDFKTTIHASASRPKYVSSFSKVYDDSIMWSHYATQHRGFCLCFSINNDSLLVSPKRTLPAKFKFHEVEYRSFSDKVDGFSMLPGVTLANQGFDRDSHFSLLEKAYLTKSESWAYEKEVRLIHSELFLSNAEGPEERAFIDRTFNYLPEQLTGVIFGARMTEEEKRQLKSVILEMREKMQVKLPPLFIFYQAKESINSFKMDVYPVFGLDYSHKFFKAQDLQKKVKEFDSIKEHYQRNGLSDNS